MEGCLSLTLLGYYIILHRVSKNIPDALTYNLRKHCPFLIIFGRNITKKASKRKMLYFFYLT